MLFMSGPRGIMVAMYIESVPNRNSPPCVLLRESYRQEGKVRKRTLANLTSWPEHLVEGLRCLLKGGTAVPELGESLRIVRSRPHGHVAAVWGTLRSIGLLQLLDRAPSRLRSLAAALIAARVLEPRSRLATARGLDEDGGSSTLAQEAGIGTAEADELYAALDWLLERQQRIEAKLAERHLEEGSLVLYDLTSCWFEGRTCELAQPGYSRDGKKGVVDLQSALFFEPAPLRRAGLECGDLALQVAGVSARQRFFEQLLDHGQEVAQGADLGQRRRVLGPDQAAGAGEQEGVADQGLRDASVMEPLGQAAVGRPGPLRGVGQPSVSLQHGPDVGAPQQGVAHGLPSRAALSRSLSRLR